MDALSSVSPSIVLPPSNNRFQRHRRLRRISVYSNPKLRHQYSLSSLRTLPYSPEPCARRFGELSCRSVAREAGGEVEDDSEDDRQRDEVERALSMDGKIPGTSDEFVRQVSSRAYDLRRRLQQTFDSSSYDVLETNPWRDTLKPVYILTHKENQLCTMKTRRSRRNVEFGILFLEELLPIAHLWNVLNDSEVERELGLLFSKVGKWRPGTGNQAKQSRTGTKFQMLVEDIREGVLVFEDETEAARYCDLLQGGGQACEGVAEIEASSVFDLCQTMRALAVLFRRGRTPPLPESLKLKLRARKRSLEDKDDQA